LSDVIPDWASISAAIREMPTAQRPIDYRLSVDQAERLRHRRLRIGARAPFALGGLAAAVFACFVVISQASAPLDVPMSAGAPTNALAPFVGGAARSMDLVGPCEIAMKSVGPSTPSVSVPSLRPSPSPSCAP
jgi:hypothetical protein